MKGDKRSLIHGLFLVFGGLMILRLMFGGRRPHPYAGPDYYQGGPQGFPPGGYGGP